MKVAIDLSPLYSSHKYRGIGFYTKRLVEAIEKINSNGIELEYIREIKQLKNTKADVVHLSHFSPFFLSLPSGLGVPSVVTIHDLIPVQYKEHFPPGIKGRLRWQVQKSRLKRVNAIVTDSKIWQEEIGKITGYPKDRIYVIPLAAGSEFKVLDEQVLKRVREKLSLPEKFVLYVGDVNWNKNVLGLIKAFEIVHKERPNLKLVLVGKAFENTNLVEVGELKKLTQHLNLGKEVIYLGWVEDRDLVAVYNLASLYCEFSFDEGFGLPVLEAMSCGCPVVAANAGSLPEVAGAAATLVNPYSVEEMSKGILDAIAKPKDETTRKALSWSKNFTWERTARLTIEVYKEVLNDKNH